MRCVISESTLDQIRRHLAAEYPDEGCGVLIGLDGAEGRVVEYAVPTRNREVASRRRYSIPPEEFLRADQAARERGLEIVGFYHSHPDVECAPSAADAAEAWSHYTYLIVSVRSGHSGSIGAWRFGDRGFLPEEMRVDDRLDDGVPHPAPGSRGAAR